MNPVIKKLNDNLASKKEAQLLLGNPKQIPEVVDTLKQKFLKYGINNDTSQFIKEKAVDVINENIKIKAKTEEVMLLKAVINDFYPFRVISYKSLYEVCNEYNLYINRLWGYKKDIPEDVFEDLASFEEMLKNLPGTYSRSTFFTDNESASFDISTYNTPLNRLEFQKAFFIAAPGNHFHKNSYNDKIGRELVKLDKPKFNLKGVKLQMPEFNDPILYLPIKLLGKVYCIIISAWDKEGDDSRIKAML